MITVGMVTLSNCAPFCVTCGTCLYPEGRGASQHVIPFGRSCHPKSGCCIALRMLKSSEGLQTLWEDTKHLYSHTQPLIVSKGISSLGTPYHVMLHINVLTA